MKYSLPFTLLSLLMLSACSSGKDKPRVDYFSATSRPALQMLSGLKIKQEPTAYTIPKLKNDKQISSTVSDYPPTLATAP